ncbi:sugar-binding transcriptional regulator [Microlunatus parietis]|uniref:DNA-binding transcriptional regulator LsrR (DeoR family) n=1 Tax=Microlunatus parietis TaxID=682979 RepID=A0A7Y9I8U5_9ACTN|nr:sugar-binding domain-containing protein [Microlunatus parietis]NYE72380.1 DNA-binding transcriptional regulator LsrR (DeoR family) [Microlunatus parietis]
MAMTNGSEPPAERPAEPGRRATQGSRNHEAGHFPASLLYTAAKMYYDDEATQADVASRLGTSRATVSRILAEARRRGIVRIEIIPPGEDSDTGLADRLAAALGLERVYLSASLRGALPAGETLGPALAPAVSTALADANLASGDVLLVSSGRTVYEVARCELRQLPGVVVAPTVGGQDQPEGWYQTNEITRMIAARVGGRATYLFAPALPGPDLYKTLIKDPSIQRVLHLWPRARCVLTGVGAPPMVRSDMPLFVPAGAASLVDAVGDVCSRFYDREGKPVPYPGSERLIALSLEELQRIPISIAVASGPDKINSILAGAQAGYFKRLVTDPATAERLVAAAA